MATEPLIVTTQLQSISDFDQVEQLASEVLQALDTAVANQPVVLMMTEVDLVASIFLSAIVRMQRHANALRRPFGVVGMKERVKNVFDRASLGNVVMNYDDVASFQKVADQKYQA